MPFLTTFRLFWKSFGTMRSMWCGIISNQHSHWPIQGHWTNFTNTVCNVIVQNINCMWLIKCWTLSRFLSGFTWHWFNLRTCKCRCHLLLNGGIWGTKFLDISDWTLIRSTINRFLLTWWYIASVARNTWARTTSYYSVWCVILIIWYLIACHLSSSKITSHFLNPFKSLLLLFKDIGTISDDTIHRHVIIDRMEALLKW